MQARNSIIPLYFDHQEIRILDEDGHPWFIAADVCKALGIQNPTQATAKLEADERSMISIGRQGDTIVLSEAGVYTIALRCRDAMKPGKIASCVGTAWAVLHAAIKGIDLKKKPDDLTEENHSPSGVDR